MLERGDIGLADVSKAAVARLSQLVSMSSEIAAICPTTPKLSCAIGIAHRVGVVLPFLDSLPTAGRPTR